MPNPYQPPRPTTASVDAKFDLSRSLRTTIGFALVGTVAGGLSGLLLEFMMNRFRYITSTQAMVLPGLLFGLGILLVTWRTVPHARKRMLVLFPLIACFGFGVIGMMYAVSLQAPTTSNSFVEQWLVTSSLSVPGTLVLSVGCLLVARPRSYTRFTTFILTTAAIAGIAPLLVNAIEPLSVLPSYMLTMFVAQVLMFTMLGWIFGDTR